MIHKTTKYYAVEVLVENEIDTIDDGIKDARKTIESLGLKVYSVKQMKSKRTLAQNNALHKWCTQMAEEFNDKGLDVRAVISKDFKIPWTMYAVKEYLWRSLQKKLLGIQSTTDLDKTGEINLIWDTINRAMIERFKGNVSVPPWPSRGEDENS
jgi:transposase